MEEIEKQTVSEFVFLKIILRCINIHQRTSGRVAIVAAVV